MYQACREHTMGLRSCYCLLLLLLSVAVTLVGSFCLNMQPCKLDCAGCDPFEHVHNPADCHSYYMCTDGGNYLPEPFCCPDGEVFNNGQHVCEPGDTCIYYSCLSCVYECGRNCNHKISSFSDCHVYHPCIDGLTGPAVTCPTSAPYFDGQECQDDQTRCCHCHAYCYENFGLVADPLDCRKYYTCEFEGTPFTSGVCPDGQYFDSTLKECSSTAPCITQCTNVVHQDGCIDPYTCESPGLVARCPFRCSPDFYYCTEATGTYQEAQSCPNGTAFHPWNHVCVDYEQCP